MFQLILQLFQKNGLFLFSHLLHLLVRLLLAEALIKFHSHLILSLFLLDLRSYFYYGNAILEVQYYCQSTIFGQVAFEATSVMGVGWLWYDRQVIYGSLFLDNLKNCLLVHSQMVWLNSEDGFFMFALDDVSFEILFLLVKLVLLQLIHQASNRVIVVIDVLVDNPRRRSSWLVISVNPGALALVVMCVLIFGAVAKSWMHKGLMTI